MKVYVVTSGEYCGSTDRAYLHGVFETEGVALIIAEEVGGEVSEVEFDELVLGEKGDGIRLI